MKITEEVLDKILLSYPSTVPEMGGILGGQNKIITEYFHDDKTNKNLERAIYMPNVLYLDSVIKKWSDSNIELYGLIHSHPANEDTLSKDDVCYIKEIMKEMKNGMKLYFPLVMPNQRIVPFVVIKSVGGLRIVEEEIEIYKK